jgi:hypothetical protein
MPLAQDHNLIKAFASDRTDQSFAMSILQRRARSRRLVANAHRTQTSFEDVATGAVTVANKIFRRLFSAAGFGELAGDPFRSGGTSTDNNVPSVQFDCDSDPSRRWTPRSGCLRI